MEKRRGHELPGNIGRRHGVDVCVGVLVNDELNRTFSTKIFQSSARIAFDPGTFHEIARTYHITPYKIISKHTNILQRPSDVLTDNGLETQFDRNNRDNAFHFGFVLQNNLCVTDFEL